MVENPCNRDKIWYNIVAVISIDIFLLEHMLKVLKILDIFHVFVDFFIFYAVLDVMVYIFLSSTLNHLILIYS